MRIITERLGEITIRLEIYKDKFIYDLQGPMEQRKKRGVKILRSHHRNGYGITPKITKNSPTHTIIVCRIEDPVVNDLPWENTDPAEQYTEEELKYMTYGYCT